MAESQNDDWADALSRLSAGEPETPATPAPPVRPVVAKAAPRPAVVRPVSAAPTPAPTPTPVARPARPTAPAVSTPPVVRAPAAMDTAAAPARPQRPMAPTVRAAVPAVPAPVGDDGVGDELTGLTQTVDVAGIFDDGDSVIVPAPEASAFAPRTASVAARRAKVRQHKNLEFRRTLIPILLTCGVICGCVGALRYSVGPDSAMVDFPLWIWTSFIVAAVVLLVFAAVNMLSVKKSLDAGVV